MGYENEKGVREGPFLFAVSSVASMYQSGKLVSLCASPLQIYLKKYAGNGTGTNRANKKKEDIATYCTNGTVNNFS